MSNVIINQNITIESQVSIKNISYVIIDNITDISTYLKNLNYKYDMKFKMFIYVKVQKTLAKSDKAKITFL